MDGPFGNNMMVLHLEDCILGAKVSVLIVRESSSNRVRERRRGDFDGERGRVDLKAGISRTGESRRGRVGKGKPGADKVAKSTVGIDECLSFHFYLHVETL